MSVKPFSSSDALTGSLVVTRSGKPVGGLTIFDVDDEHCLAGVVEGRLETWTIDGTYAVDGQPSSLDLVLLDFTRRTVYANFYRGESTGISGGGRAYYYESEEEAKKRATKDCFLIALPVEISG